MKIFRRWKRDYIELEHVTMRLFKLVWDEGGFKNKEGHCGSNDTSFQSGSDERRRDSWRRFEKLRARFNTLRARTLGK